MIHVVEEIDRVALDELRRAYRAIEDMAALVDGAQHIDKNKDLDRLDFTNFCYLMRFLNSEFYRLVGDV